MASSCIACCIFHIISIPFNCSDTALAITIATTYMHTLATPNVNHSRMQVRFHTDSVLPANFAVWDDIQMLICEYVCHASKRILSMQHIICKDTVTALRKLTSVVNTRRLSSFPGDTYRADGSRILWVDLRGDGRG